MTNAYPQLTYRGDVTSSEQAQLGYQLGYDELHRPYEVIDAEFIPAAPSFDAFVEGCAVCGWRVDAHTHVNLQYVT